MKWAIKNRVPEECAPSPCDSSRLFRASSDRGEYDIQQQSGKFAIHLDGVPLTGYIYKNAVQAMRKAGKYDKQLADLMDSAPIETLVKCKYLTERVGNDA